MQGLNTIVQITVCGHIRSFTAFMSVLVYALVVPKNKRLKRGEILKQKVEEPGGRGETDIMASYQQQSLSTQRNDSTTPEVFSHI